MNNTDLFPGSQACQFWNDYDENKTPAYSEGFEKILPVKQCPTDSKNELTLGPDEILDIPYQGKILRVHTSELVTLSLLDSVEYSNESTFRDSIWKSN